MLILIAVINRERAFKSLHQSSLSILVLTDYFSGIYLLCNREGKNFSSPKTPFEYFQGDHAVPFFPSKNEF